MIFSFLPTVKNTDFELATAASWSLNRRDYKRFVVEQIERLKGQRAHLCCSYWPPHCGKKKNRICASVKHKINMWPPRSLRRSESGGFLCEGFHV